MTWAAHDPGGSTAARLNAEGVTLPAAATGEFGPPAAPHLILIVEDDHTEAGIVRDILEVDGYAIVHADRGEAALAILASPSCQVELVLLDLILPDLDGLEVLAALRERATDPRLPVIITTARGMPADRAAALKGAADDYLVKPVLPDELLLKVRTLLFHRSLEKQAHQLAALCRMIRVVHSSLNVRVVLDRGVEQAVAALAADGGNIQLYEGEPARLSLKTHQGIPDALIERLLRTPAAPEPVSLPAPVMVDLTASTPSSLHGLGEELKLFRKAGFGGAALIPLETQGGVAGILTLYTKRATAIRAQDMSFLTAVGDLISTALENARLHEEVTNQALTDTLTGLPNRRHFEHRLREEVRRAVRSRRPLAVLLVDVDQFKTINDRRGHAAGDHILRRVAASLGTTLRETDLIARYGGDEFTALLPETSRATALQVAERLRCAVAEHAYRTDTPGGPLRVTISIGVATMPEDGAVPGAILERADRALYRAKFDGRNCVRAVTDAPSADPELARGHGEMI
jgi:diguanylate cyclase (GGDEF)-like protein